MFSVIITTTNEKTVVSTYSNESKALKMYCTFVDVMLPVLVSITLVNNSDMSTLLSADFKA